MLLRFKIYAVVSYRRLDALPLPCENINSVHGNIVAAENSFTSSCCEIRFLFNYIGFLHYNSTRRTRMYIFAIYFAQVTVRHHQMMS